MMEIADILEELVGFYAYDRGATDSGVHDDGRRAELSVLWREALEVSGYSVAEGKWFREYWLSDERLGMGYGMDSASEFYRWLEDLP